MRSRRSAQQLSEHSITTCSAAASLSVSEQLAEPSVPHNGTPQRPALPEKCSDAVIGHRHRFVATTLISE